LNHAIAVFEGKINGNAGKRIACAIIGISKDNF